MYYIGNARGRPVKSLAYSGHAGPGFVESPDLCYLVWGEEVMGFYLPIQKPLT